MPVITEAKAGGIEVLAFLDMLAWSEGTSTIKSRKGVEKGSGTKWHLRGLRDYCPDGRRRAVKMV